MSEEYFTHFFHSNNMFTTRYSVFTISLLAPWINILSFNAKHQHNLTKQQHQCINPQKITDQYSNRTQQNKSNTTVHRLKSQKHFATYQTTKNILISTSFTVHQFHTLKPSTPYFQTKTQLEIQHKIKLTK